jgi:hypothetical protein
MTNQIEPAASADGASDRVGQARKRDRKDAIPSASDGARAIARAAAPIAVRWLPVEALKPDKRNARKHSVRQVARIADSILAFGFNVPILVDEKGVVLAGHGRLLAAKRLGLKEAPAITLGHLNEGERRAFMIADNRLSELASWDEGRLGLELEELKSLDLDFTIEATGFEVGEIDLRIEARRTPGRSRAKPNTSAPPAPIARRETGVFPDAQWRGRVGVRGRAALGNSGSRGGRLEKHGETPLLGTPPQGGRESVPAVARAGETWSLGPHWLCCGDAGDAAACRAVDAAIRRWQALTGESARLHPTGETFDSAARARRKPPSRRGRGAREGADLGRQGR